MTDLIERVKVALGNATPGPWRLSAETCYSGRMSGSYYRVFDDNLNAICSEEYGAYNDGGDDNMNLIALAPDMARALVAAEELMKAVQDEHNLAVQDMGEMMAASERVEAALTALRATLEGKE